MTARQIRRAQARRETKEIRRETKELDRAQAQPEAKEFDRAQARPDNPHINTAAAPSPSNAQLAANRANALLSTGPTSDEGKAICSLNAVKTGLTGRTVLLPDDDAVAYSALIAGFVAEWQPATDTEHRLVQSLADTEWRLLRIPVLEAGIYAIGRLEAAGQFPGEPKAAVRAALIDANIFLRYQRQLNNLSIQENRLRRQREKDTAQLRQIQQERQQRAAGASAIGSEFSSVKESENTPRAEAYRDQSLIPGASNAPETAALGNECLAEEECLANAA